MPSNMDLPMSGDPHLNSRIAVCEMNFKCFFVGRLKRALLITDCTLSFSNSRRCCTRNNHTCKKYCLIRFIVKKNLGRLRVCLTRLHGAPELIEAIATLVPPITKSGVKWTKRQHDWRKCTTPNNIAHEHSRTSVTHPCQTYPKMN